MDKRIAWLSAIGSISILALSLLDNPFYFEEVRAVENHFHQTGKMVRFDEYIPVGLRAAATRTCAGSGFEDIQCRNDLLAIMWKESHFRPYAVGDDGCSVGSMQINLCQHGYALRPVARDPEKAMAWAIDYLMDNGYPQDRDFAFRAYNAGPGGARRGISSGYAAEVAEIAGVFGETKEGLDKYCSNGNMGICKWISSNYGEKSQISATIQGSAYIGESVSNGSHGSGTQEVIR